MIADQTWTIITKAVEKPPVRASACFLFAAAAHAALRGTGASFEAGGAFLASSGITGWGLSVSPREGTAYYHGSEEVDDEDGSYCGHCWVRFPSRHWVVDVMEEFAGHQWDTGIPICYHPVKTLTQSIRDYHAETMRRVQREVRQHPDYIAAVRKFAGID